jgi:hypothetical protein
MATKASTHTRKVVCATVGCGKAICARGLCTKHYQQARSSERPLCAVEGCSNRRHNKDGYCAAHALRIKKSGDPEVHRPLRSIGADQEARRWGYDHHYSPDPKTDRRLKAIEDVLEAYKDILPITTRQLYYRLVATNKIEKGPTAEGDLMRDLRDGRRGGRIPYESIRVEETPSLPYVFADQAEFEDDLRTNINVFQLDPQAGAPRYVELWCESDGMRPQIAPIAEKYGVPVYSSGGSGSVTAVHNMAKRVAARDVPTTLLHVGDFDGGGIALWESLAGHGAAYVAEMRPGAVWFEPIRLMLTEAQVLDLKLPTEEEDKQSAVAKSWREERSWRCQLEAVSPDEINQMVDTALSEYFTADRLYAQRQTSHQIATSILNRLDGE